MNILKYLSCGYNNIARKNPNTCMEPIEDINIEGANLTKFVPVIKRGRVVKVYDGDTITIGARMEIEGKETYNLYQFSVRLHGIDTPELKTKNPTEKSLAILARDDLSSMILGKVVTLTNVSYDKYGRILANVQNENGVDMSQWMIEKGHAVSYDGGTKKRPAEWTD